MRDTSVFVFDVLFFSVNCLPLRALPMLFLHIVLFFPLLLFSLFCFLYTGYRFVFWECFCAFEIGWVDSHGSGILVTNGSMGGL